MTAISLAHLSRSCLLFVLALLVMACATPPRAAISGEEDSRPLVIYSGRNENLIEPLVERFRAETGIDVEVRYGETSEMAATILEEGQNSPADVFFAQDAGALGALAAEGRLQALPDELLAPIDARLRSPDGRWAAISGRARVVVYNTDRVNEAELPDSLWGFTDPAWRGRVAWAPTNGSFQAMVTAMRQLEGEERTRQWLEAMLANDVQVYANNTAIVDAAGKGEVDAGLVNHYYLFRFLAEQGEAFPARNYHLRSGDVGAMVNVAGVGILDTSRHAETAQEFVAYLLSPEAQAYFGRETHEYPVIAGVAIDPRLKPLSELKAPAVELGALQDLQGTLELLQRTGAL